MEKKKVNKVEKEEKINNTDELEIMQDKYMRLQAEFMNFKIRSEKENSDRLKYEGQDIIVQLLAISDNFERAFKMDDNDLSDEVSKFLDGFKMIYASVQSMFTVLEVKEVDCLGKEFDPNMEEAVLVEHDENKPANVVLEVYTKGYTYKEKLIRPAMVKVNK
ncbi:MAG: nucleotide exchange factor GrpE [Bacilli bacterium]